MSKSVNSSAAVLRRRAIPIALGIVLLALGWPHVAGLILAHEGHDTEVSEYDLDAPRTVSPETAKHMELKTAEVEFRKIEDVVELSGIVKSRPDRRRAVASRVSGLVTAIKKQVGDPVKKGELLVQMDSPELARNLYAARKLKIELKYLLSERARAQALVGAGVTEQELIRRKAAVAAAEEDLKAREALIKSLYPGVDVDGDPTGTLQITAELDGVVVKRLVIPGQWIEAGRTILEIADYSAVQIEGELPESFIARVRARKTNKVRIRAPADPGYRGEGTIRYIAPELDPIKRTAHLIVDAPNPSGVLRGEMWVDLAVLLREVKEALVVPHSAVIVHGPMHFVFIKDEELLFTVPWVDFQHDLEKGVFSEMLRDAFVKQEIKLPDNVTIEAENGGKEWRITAEDEAYIVKKDDEKLSIYDEAQYKKRDIEPGVADDRFVEVKSGLGPGDVIVVQGAYSLTHLRPKGKKRRKPKKDE